MGNVFNKKSIFKISSVFQGGYGIWIDQSGKNFKTFILSLQVLSRDSVTVSVDAVVYYRVSNPTMATNNIEDYSHSTRLLAATTLRNVLGKTNISFFRKPSLVNQFSVTGTKNLAEILSERETISQVMQNALDEATDPWGVKVRVAKIAISCCKKESI